MKLPWNTETEVKTLESGAVVPLNELGAAPTYSALPEYVAELVSRFMRLRVYEKMTRNDAQVRATLRATKIPILGGEWATEPYSEKQVDQDAAEFLEYNLHNMSNSWTSFLDDALRFEEFGSSIFEKVFYQSTWTPKNGSSRKPKNVLMWKKLAPRPLHTISKFNYDENGGPVSIEQRVQDANGRQRVATIPIDKLIVFTYDKQGGDLEGQSLLRTAYKHWYYKENLYKIDGIQKERHGLGVPTIELPPNATKEDKEAAMEMLQNIRTNQSSGFVKPPGWIIEFAEVHGNLVDALKSAQEHDTMIARNVLVQFINAGQGDNGGSNAGSATMADLFMKSLHHTANIVADTLFMYGIKQLIDFNFKVDGYPKLLVRHLGESRELQQWASALLNLQKAGLITGDMPTEQYVRREVRIPAKTEDRPEVVAPPNGAGFPDRSGNMNNDPTTAGG